MLIGNKLIQNYFDNLIKKDSFTHAYLFYGPEGVGKKMFSLEIAKRLLGNLVIDLDLKIIDKGENQIYISDIKDLRNFLYLTSFRKYKIALINNAHNLNQEASNALLKILEEPPGEKTIIFLITNFPNLLLPTIISRCQLIRFKPIKREEILNNLLKEKINKELASAAVKFANGSFGLAKKLIDNFKKFEKNINLLKSLEKENFLEKSNFAKNIANNQEELKELIRDWLIYLKANIKNFSKPELIRELLYLNNIISQPQFNQRLALEKFLLKLY